MWFGDCEKFVEVWCGISEFGGLVMYVNLSIWMYELDLAGLYLQTADEYKIRGDVVGPGL